MQYIAFLARCIRRGLLLGQDPPALASIPSFVVIRAIGLGVGVVLAFVTK
jgi:hypothetical protein